jgi:myo-inositol-1(or 4)-monophosphatase
MSPEGARGGRDCLAAALARAGGDLALDAMTRARVSCKPDGTVVTDVDLRVQELVIDGIRHSYPDDGILAEEDRLTVGPPDARYQWVIDPIDGSGNFGRGLPGFAVSIGVLRDGWPWAGAVYDPLARWLFAATMGRGAWFNGRLLATSRAPLGAVSLIAIRSPFDGEVPAFVIDWLRHHRIRRYGSTALQLCYVAMGGLDVVYDHRASLWDIAGAAPIVLEAGGRLTAPGGVPLFPITAAQRSGAPIAFLAASAGAHATALAHLQGLAER